MTILVIGAGPTGLGAAVELDGRESFLLLEQASKAGGLATSYETPEGFTFDLGGHVTFSRNEGFLATVETATAGQINRLRRDARISMADRLIPYPFQHNLDALPEGMAWECVEGLLDRKSGPATNFYDYMELTFGRGIRKHFLLPYNRKVWACDPRDLSCDWLRDRVSPVDLRAILKPFITGRSSDSGWGPNATFLFPKKGTGAIWGEIAASLPRSSVLYETKVEAIDSEARELRTQDGRIFRYDALISSMPLDQMAGMLSKAPGWLAKEAARLRHNQGFFVGVGIRGVSPCDHHWTYFPEARHPFYRVTVLSNYSREIVPGDGFFSLLAEVSLPDGEPVDPVLLEREVVAALLETPLLAGIPESAIVSVGSRLVPYSYPLPTLDRDEARGRLLDYLRSRDILSRGRFGSFRYEQGNMDHAWLSGRSAARSLLGATAATPTTT